MKVFKTIDDKIGMQNNMPVIFEGINYILFEPFNGTIDESADPLGNEGFFITEEKLKIAIEV